MPRNWKVDYNFIKQREKIDKSENFTRYACQAKKFESLVLFPVSPEKLGLHSKNKYQRKRFLRLGTYYGYDCFYCGESFSRQNPATLEHVLPQSQGGLIEDINIVLACHTCNNTRLDTNFATFCVSVAQSNNISSNIKFLERLKTLYSLINIVYMDKNSR